MNRYVVFVLSMPIALSCAETGDSYQIIQDSDNDTGTVPVTGDTETASDPHIDAGVGEEDTALQPGLLGEPCWNKDKLPSGHPNWGMPDCNEDFTCIGDNDEAWCTEKCLETGKVSKDAAIDGWCCGEITAPCDPARYWLPPSMDAACAPRDIPLGQPCSSDGNSRCAPICSGDEEVFRVTCAATSLDSGFCTHTCETHLDCLDADAFSDGCCGEIMGGTYCLPEVSDDCLPIS